MASDLHEIGLIDKWRMREFDALCNLSIKEIPPQKIKQLREEAHICQAVLAAVLNT
jgi:putative transcriptional regulator